MEYGLLQVFQLQNLVAMMAGILVGLIAGVIPGITISMGMIIILPLTFTISPIAALCMLIGLYQAGMSGGAISAILLNIPGTPAATATAIDGYALARKGDAQRALQMSCIASLIGGFIGLFFLALVAPLLAQVALKFGPIEQFFLILVSMTLIAGLSQGALVKGCVSALLGLMLVTIGMDPMVGTPRFTFGSLELAGGLSWLPVMIGGYAVPEILREVRSVGWERVTRIARFRIFAPINWADMRRSAPVILMGGLVGTGVGALPGANAPVAVFLAYDLARRRVKNPEEFGEGAIEGVAAPESANNAVAGGAMIPLLTLGIPGDTITAILLGALTIHGFSPGPMFFFEHGRLIYAIFLIFLVANILQFVTVWALCSPLARLALLPKGIVLPIIAVFCVVGTLLFRNNLFDVYVMLGAGLLAYVMERYGFPFIPLILAMILGPQLEKSFRLALILSGGNPIAFATSPIGLTIVTAGALLLYASLRRKGKLAGFGEAG
jgi:putative tricarboxylic transport membrane protein